MAYYYLKLTRLNFGDNVKYPLGYFESMKFSHIADAHLGAFSKNRKLSELNLKAFKIAIEKSIEESVDFIIIAGDLFHNPLPDMDIVKSTVSILQRAKEQGIRIYVVYGSHDFSAGTTSLLDVLSEAGVFRKVVRYEIHDGKLRLIPIKDPSGVYLVGMPGLTAAREVFYFLDEEQGIDREYLESVPNPKIFIFHTTVNELKPEYIADKNAVPLSRFPRGFDYYAGGHLHERIEHKLDSGYLTYPGALFGSNYSDLDVLTDKQRGFYIVEDFKPRFVPVKVCEFEKVVFKADGNSATELQKKLMEFASRNHEGRVVILKVRGELKSGKVADINFRAIRDKILESAIDVLVNTYALRSVESGRMSVPVEEQEEIERRVFEEISEYGLNFTVSLFNLLRQEKKDEETKSDFERRITQAAMDMIEHAVKNYIKSGEKSDKGELIARSEPEIETVDENAEDEVSENCDKKSEDIEESSPKEKTPEDEKRRKVKAGRVATLFDFG